jgi:hypothetical protein
MPSARMAESSAASLMADPTSFSHWKSPRMEAREMSPLRFRHQDWTAAHPIRPEGLGLAHVMTPSKGPERGRVTVIRVRCSGTKHTWHLTAP